MSTADALFLLSKKLDLACPELSKSQRLEHTRTCWRKLSQSEKICLNSAAQNEWLFDPQRKEQTKYCSNDVKCVQIEALVPDSSRTINVLNKQYRSLLANHKKLIKRNSNFKGYLRGISQSKELQKVLARQLIRQSTYLPINDQMVRRLLDDDTIAKANKSISERITKLQKFAEVAE